MRVRIGLAALALLSGSVPAPARSQECTPEIALDTPAPSGTWGFRWRVRMDFVDGQFVKNEYPRVSRVDCGGPGHLAGVRVGDEIIAVDSTDARKVVFPARFPGMTRLFRVRRGAEEFEVHLRAIRRKTVPARMPPNTVQTRHWGSNIPGDISATQRALQWRHIQSMEKTIS